MAAPTPPQGPFSFTGDAAPDRIGIDQFARLAEQQRKIAELQAEQSRLEAVEEAQKKIIAGQLKQIDRYNKTKTALNGSLSGRDKMLHQKDKQIEQSKMTIEEQKTTIELRDETIADNDRWIAELEATLKAQKSTIDEQRVTIEGLNSTIGEQKATIRGNDTTIAGLNSTIEELRDSIEEQKTTISVQRTSIEGLDATIEEHKATIEGYKKTVTGHESTIENYKTTIEGHKTITDAYKAAIRTRDTNIERSKKTLDETKAILEEHKDTIKTQLTTIRQRDATVASQLRSVNGVAEKEANWKLDFDALQKQSDDFEEEVKEEQRRHNETRLLLITALASNNALTTTMDQAEKDRDEAHVKIEKDTETIKDTSTDLEDALEKLSVEEEKNKQAVKDFRSLQADGVAVVKQLDDSKAKVTALTKERDDLLKEQATHADIEVERDQALVKIRALEVEIEKFGVEAEDPDKAFDTRANAYTEPYDDPDEPEQKPQQYQQTLGSELGGDFDLESEPSNFTSQKSRSSEDGLDSYIEENEEKENEEEEKEEVEEDKTAEIKHQDTPETTTNAVETVIETKIVYLPSPGTCHNPLRCWIQTEKNFLILFGIWFAYFLSPIIRLFGRRFGPSPTRSANAPSSNDPASGETAVLVSDIKAILASDEKDLPSELLVGATHVESATKPRTLYQQIITPLPHEVPSTKNTFFSMLFHLFLYACILWGCACYQERELWLEANDRARQYLLQLLKNSSHDHRSFIQKFITPLLSPYWGHIVETTLYKYLAEPLSMSGSIPMPG